MTTKEYAALHPNEGQINDDVQEAARQAIVLAARDGDLAWLADVVTDAEANEGKPTF